MTAAKAPQVLTDPTLSKVFAKILEVSGSGISPISLGMGQTITQTQSEPTDVAQPSQVAPPELTAQPTQ